eukprot:TRINITY_DN11966_c0_g1_i1.p1 TRINITY_DN11966_c0_g1~~TRINITY_DN11966_c0_g1_i1.p1  ORF type:complete len:478 (-),score=40.82 TRINITY_DN11966_c0_g1_i1:209-1642(-)
MRSSPSKLRENTLDDFISHDWASSRFQKTVALCMIFNSNAAMVSSAAVGVGFYFLQRARLLPVYQHPRGFGMYSQIVCPLVFVVVFFCWQDLRVACRLGTRKVFLDKYCIDQKNVQRKAKGILGLGAYLKASERLVICWTPRYFTRLWCVYEIASWLRLGKGLDKILVMPLTSSSAVLVSVLVNQSATLTFHFIFSISRAGFLLVFLVAASFAAHTYRHFEYNLKRLPQQVSDFSVTKAECFCCKVGHKTPGGNEPIPCDRELIYETLQTWFPVEDDCAPTWERKLAMFDEEVQARFGAFISQRVGLRTMHYKYIVLAGQPYLWRLLDVAVGFGNDEFDAVQSFRAAVEYVCFALCVVPVNMRVIMLLAAAFNDRVGIPSNWYKDVLVSMFGGCLVTVSALSCWYAVSRDVWKGNLSFFAAASVWILILTPLSYWESFPCFLRRASSAKPSTPQNSECAPELVAGTVTELPSNSFSM